MCSVLHPLGRGPARVVAFISTANRTTSLSVCVYWWCHIRWVSWSMWLKGELLVKVSHALTHPTRQRSGSKRDPVTGGLSWMKPGRWIRASDRRNVSEWAAQFPVAASVKAMWVKPPAYHCTVRPGTMLSKGREGRGAWHGKVGQAGLERISSRRSEIWVWAQIPAACPASSKVVFSRWWLGSPRGPRFQPGRLLYYFSAKDHWLVLQGGPVKQMTNQ